MTVQPGNLTAAEEVRVEGLGLDRGFAPKFEPSFYAVVGKRALDLVAVMMTLWITVPVIAIMALAVALTGNKPFYLQNRVGLNGKSFRMIKLRTMVPNADALLEKHLAENPEARAEWDANQKLRNDPRIIPVVGHFFRKTSLDELPQLLNVFNGTMSLVGPRPMMTNQRAMYFGRAYFKLRPGMTGPWQISDRNGCEFTGRVSFDEDYSRGLSFWGDLRILVGTVGVVLRGTGI